MAQWTNFQRIKRFVNPMQLYIPYEKSVGLHLAELGLMAVRLGRQSDKKNLGEVEILKTCCRLIFHCV